MATKEYYPSYKDNPEKNNNSTGKFGNLILIQNHPNLTTSPLLSQNVITNEKKFSNDGFDDYGKISNPISWNKCKNDSPPNYLNIDDGLPKEKSKGGTKSALNSSTLSLHITAYENSVEGNSDSEIVKSKNDKEKFIEERRNVNVKFDAIKYPFEFPRQQNDEQITEPEVTQFTASQKLLNPNVVETEKEKFYNSLDQNQKQFFDKFEKQQNDKLVKIQNAFHEKEKECDELMSKLADDICDREENVEVIDETEKSADVVFASEQSQTPTKGSEYRQKLAAELLFVGVDIDNEDQQITSINNYIYFRLLKLLTEPSQRRLKLLQLFGFSCHQNDPKVLSRSFMYRFDEAFKQSRSYASSNNLTNFDNQIIEFPKDQLPFIETTVIDSSSEVNENCGMPPVLEAMVMDGEPLPKKSRIEPEIVNLPSTVNTESQTDLKLKNILELEGIKGKIKNLKKQIAYYKDKSGNLKEVNQNFEKVIADLEKEEDELEEKSDELNELRNVKEKLNEEVRERDGIIMELNEQLENHKKGNKFFLKNQSGKYTVEAHTCFSRLISQGGVAQVKVGMVILILAEFFKIAIDAVPSRWTVGRDIHMIHSLNCEYIINFINDCTNLSWLSDETTKFFKKIQANVLAGKRNKTQQNAICYVGFGEVPDKSAARCLEEFKLLLSNIARIGKLDVEKFIHLVVINIRNCMGDQASTTKLVYSLFIAFRDFCLENSNFDEATKESLQRVNCFFCMLHILSNSSAIVFNALLNHEKFCTNNEQVTEATVLWVLNEVPRYFAKRSSGKHSTAAQWETLRKEMELKFSKIDSNLGHRFIIRFKIASEIVHNHKEIIAFLENLGNSDETLINLKTALQNDLVILHLHILALLGSLILQPMWQLCDASESVLQMSLYAPALLKYLKELVEDPMLLFTVNSPFDAFPGAAPKENSKTSAFLKSLKERPIPVGSSEVVPIVAEGLLEYFKKQLEPFVSGAYSSPDIALERETAGAPLTNMACESGFGYMDHLFTTKPNMTTFNRSALTVANKNKLFEYITKLPDEQRNAMYLRAFDNKELSAKLAAEKSQQIHRENVEHIEKLALKQRLEKQKKEAKKKKTAVDVREGGFWLTIDEMNAALLNVPKTTAIKYIKSNIRFRKAVWNKDFTQQNLLKFTHQKHVYSYDELKSNLMAVIAADHSNPDPDASEDSDSEEE